jgi:hypothetical protein
MLTKEQERLGQAVFADLTREQLLHLLTRVPCDESHASRRRASKEKSIGFAVSH